MFSFQLNEKGKRFVFTALVLVLLSAFLVSCDKEPKANLNGTWNYTSGNYSYDIKINTTAKTIEYGTNYKGNIVNSPNYEDASGVIIIEFTYYYETVYGGPPEYAVISSGETTKYNGKYGAMYWKDLTLDSVYLADAYESSTHAMRDSLAQAQADFTLSKVGNYINWSYISPYTKTQ